MLMDLLALEKKFMDALMNLRHSTLEVGFEEFRFVSLGFSMLDGFVIMEGIQLYRLVRSSSIFVLNGM